MRLFYVVPAGRPAALLFCLLHHILSNETTATSEISGAGSSGSLVTLGSTVGGAHQRFSLEDGVVAYEDIGLEHGGEDENADLGDGPLFDMARGKDVRDLARERTPIRGLKRIATAIALLFAVYIVYFRSGEEITRDDEEGPLLTAHDVADAIVLQSSYVAGALNVFLPKDMAIHTDVFMRTIAVPLFLSGIYELVHSLFRRRGWVRRSPYPVPGILSLIGAAAYLTLVLSHALNPGEDFSNVDRNLTSIGVSLMFVGAVLLGHSLRTRSLERRTTQKKNFTEELQDEEKALGGNSSDIKSKGTGGEKSSVEHLPDAVVQP